MSLLIKNLSLNYKNELVFNKLSLRFDNKTVNNIIGLSNNQKNALFNLLLKKIKTNDIFIDDILITNYKIKQKIAIIFNNVNYSFIKKTVYQEIKFSLENLKYSLKEKDELIKYYIDLFKIQHIINRDINSLSGGEKYKVSLISNLIYNPTYLIIDNSFEMLDISTKHDIMEIIKYLVKTKDLCVINLVNNISEAILPGRNYIFKNNLLIFYGNEYSLANSEDLLLDFGFILPPLINLGYKLKLYEVLKENTFELERMIDTLWE